MQERGSLGGMAEREERGVAPHTVQLEAAVQVYVIGCLPDDESFLHLPLEFFLDHLGFFPLDFVVRLHCMEYCNAVVAVPVSNSPLVLCQSYYESATCLPNVESTTLTWAAVDHSPHVILWSPPFDLHQSFPDGCLCQEYCSYIKSSDSSLQLLTQSLHTRSWVFLHLEIGRS